MFDELDQKSFSEREEDVMHFWEKEQIFKKSLDQRQQGQRFSFYDGPPFATGLPHYGHLLAGTIKDVVPRYKTMKGYHVPRTFGWDCHGIPVENEVEKSHQLSGAATIEKFGIANFNEACRSIVLRFTKEWKSTVSRMGRWVDFDKTWHTMDLPFMESVWWGFKQLYEKGLVYEGLKVMPFSAKLGTPLSNFEASENYKEVEDPSLTLSLQSVEDPKTHYMVWTTTPWTLISNLAITVGADLEYVKIYDKERELFYILAKARLNAYYKDESAYEIVETFLGRDLKGRRYHALFPYFASHAAKGAFRVIAGEHVSIEDGTGIVHTAPAFGEEDFYVCQAEGIEPVCPVDANGNFLPEIPEYAGLFVKDADKKIIRRLKEMDRVIKHTTERHRYPFCPRTDTPLIYRTINSWFVRVEAMRDQLVALNQQIHWTPQHVKEKRFGNWLQGARDWAISRSRYWGTPIPLWRAKDGSIICLGSIAELEQLAGVKIHDLHRHFIDQLVIHKDGKEYRRIPEVFDCWFESGSMPFAQIHYPFENQQLFNERHPADFIAEGLDQTRGWFYTLHILSSALFGKPAFKNVVVNGIVLAEDGAKMSKRLRNYPDPLEVVKKYGADAIRLYLLHSPVVLADDLRFSEHGVEILMRQVLIPWWNAYSFFITYARIYKWNPGKDPHASAQPIDQWILSRLNKLIHDVEMGMDSYDLSQAVEPFIGFIDQLTNWYIRRSRRRFWSEEDTQERRDAFQTLYLVLTELAKVAAPFVPFISDVMYRNLRGSSMPASVHLCDYPAYHPRMRHLDLERAMEATQTVVSLGHALRKEHRVKVRQPLPSVSVIVGDQSLIEVLREQSHLIAEELNVKDVLFCSNEEEYVSLKGKPNFRILGKKVGKRMRQVQERISLLTYEELENLRNGQSLSISVEEEEILLTPEDIEVERSVKEGLAAANEGAITILLDTSFDENLALEGIARDLIRAVNSMRKEMGLAVTDRITLHVQGSARIAAAVERHQQFISSELLAIAVSCNGSGKEGQKWDLGDESAALYIQPAKV